jgi:pimeloyl-ACP methyl ester carboxylesterase
MGKRILRAGVFIIGGILTLVIGLLIALWIVSPGKADPITGPDGIPLEGSISVIEKVILGGLDQYLIIRGADSANPVMLFLHGGPGSPEFAFMKHFNPDIEKDFVMVYWEQRGAGKSYSKDIPVEGMNMQQFISDTKELSEYLIERFNQEKIYIMGHSWGSLLGILTAWKHPELFRAYFGIGQVAHQYRGELISYEWAKEQAHKNNNEKAIKSLDKLSFPDSLASSKEWIDFLMVERNYVNKFGGGTMRDFSGMWPLVKIVLKTKEYTFAEKINFMNASLFSLEHLWNEVIDLNLNNEIDSMQVPVYIFHGKHDFTTPYSVAKEFFNQLKAPHKKFFTFENSAHSPVFEEVNKFNAIIRSII